MAIDRSSKKIISFQLGDRSLKTGRKLWEKIENIPVNKYFSDYWTPYKKFLPANKHRQTKAETYTIEGWNSTLRHYIARFHRRTHCYSKSTQMVKTSLYLFTHKELALSLLS